MSEIKNDRLGLHGTEHSTGFKSVTAAIGGRKIIATWALQQSSWRRSMAVDSKSIRENERASGTLS